MPNPPVTESADPRAPDVSGSGPAAAIAALEAELAATPRQTRPHHHAALAYRLGVAYAETPSGDGAASLRKALACYDIALAIFDPRFEPVEHARVLNAAGAAQRQRRDLGQARALFQRSVELMRGRGGDEELAATLNNLGLVAAESGDPAEAVTAFDEALSLFGDDTAQGRRGVAATLHNRGQARAQAGDEEGLRAAVVDYLAALDVLDPAEAPYHHGLVLHSLGVAYTSLAAWHPDEGLVEEAIDSFDGALVTFTRSSFPYQHALAKNNLGLAWASLGADQHQRRALACFEDALAIFDPRLHAAEWRATYANLERAEAALAGLDPPTTRADHLAALVAGLDAEERALVVGERLFRLLELPEPRRRAAMEEWAAALARRGREAARQVIEAELEQLMHVPNESLEALLRGHMDAHARLEGDEREEADRALDEAVGWTLGGPQRVFVRDFLYSLGFERP